MRTLYLVRHGQHRHVPLASDSSGWAAEHSLDDDIIRRQDGGLTASGRQQAELSAQALSTQQIHAIYSSTLPRALETATIIAAQLPNVPVMAERDLWECVPHVPTKLAHQASEFPPALLERDRHHASAAFERYFQPVAETEQREIIIAHGNLIRYFICRALNITLDAWVNMYTYNCGISTVQIQEDGACILISFNELGHLPEHLRTFAAVRG